MEFMKLPFYFLESEEAEDEYQKKLDDWRDAKDRAEDIGIKFTTPEPSLVDMPKVLKDKYVNTDYIESFWEGTENKTTLSMADGMTYSYQIKFSEFLELVKKYNLV